MSRVYSRAIAPVKPTRAHGITNRGQVVGVSFTSTNSQAALRDNEQVIALGALAGDALSYANGINDMGDIVGESSNSSFEGIGQAVLWQHKQ